MDLIRTGARGPYSSTQGETGYYAFTFYRTLYTGMPCSGSSAGGSATWPTAAVSAGYYYAPNTSSYGFNGGITPGHLQVASNGLGYLLSCGYLQDASIFYCPSSGGSLTRDQVPNATYYTNPSYVGITSPAQLKQVGGLSADAIASGDYTWLGTNRWGVYDPEITIQCDYNYRDVVTNLGNGATLLMAQAGGVFLNHTSPAVQVTAGVPSFKTQKILGSRAIVSDTFSGPYWTTAGMPLQPGMGVNVHKDGYNVLYGDSSVKWYGDPKQTIAWYMPLFDTSTTGRYCWQYALESNWACTFTSLDGSVTYDKRCGPQIWHLFDVDHGIDVGK
jgi:hypothetical protein